MVSGGFEPVFPRFFKILLGEDLDMYMYLPPRFARTVKHLANQETQLEDVTERRWTVMVSWINDSLAFQEGWRKFFLDHDLEEGQLLVFAYQGSHFTVQIFTKSACERIRFNNELPRLAKKCRKDRGTSSEDEPYQTTDVNSGDKTITASLIPPGNEFKRRKTNLEVTNADFEVTQPLSKPVNIEDPISVTNGDNGWYEERRNLLYDLSCFEMENRTSVANKSQKGSTTVLDTLHTETAQPDVTGKASDTKLSLSGIGIVEPTKPVFVELTKPVIVEPTKPVIVEPTKPAGDEAMEQTETTMKDAEMAEIETDVIMGDSGGISNDKFEKDLDAEAALSHMENADQITKEVDDTPMAPHSGQAGSDSCDAFVNKSSDNSNKKKGVLENVCDCQNGNIHRPALGSSSPSIGSGKITGRERAAKSKIGKSSTSSAPVELPLGGHPIKKELVEWMSNDIDFNPFSSDGKKQRPVVWNHAPMYSPIVKVEPGTGPSDTISSLVNYPFSAEVKSKFYLELPVRIHATTRGKTRSLVQMVVFLTNSTGSLWPVLYSEYIGGRAFTINWADFCEQNKIRVGDKCRFTGKDNDSVCVYEVSVPPRRAVVSRFSGASVGIRS